MGDNGKMVVDWQLVMKNIPTLVNKDDIKLSEIGNMVKPKDKSEHEHWVTQRRY